MEGGGSQRHPGRRAATTLILSEGGAAGAVEGSAFWVPSPLVRDPNHDLVPVGLGGWSPSRRATRWRASVGGGVSATVASEHLRKQCPRHFLSSPEFTGATPRLTKSDLGSMPEISRFFGIVIRMYFNDHGPPHFHAAYGQAEATIRIDPVSRLAGRLPPRVLALVVEWATLHERELLENWGRLQRAEPTVAVAPLE